MFYGATDALLDASQAAASYASIISVDTGANLLACHGFLQALYVQQDAVITLSRALGLNWHPNGNKRLKKIRDARNRLSGHPALAGEHEKPRRQSSAIIPYSGITKRGFRGHVYYGDGSEDVQVDVATFQNDNEKRLALQMKNVEKAMDDKERQFRKKEALKPFSSHFGTGFQYLLQRLHCDLKDKDRLGQAQAHAVMIREKLKFLEKELAGRGFKPESHSMQILFTGLNLLEKLMERRRVNKNSQDEFDLIYDGFEKRINSLRAMVSAIDGKLRAPVSQR